jgi:hypothetical protein
MKKIAFAFIAAMAVLSFAGCKKKSDFDKAMEKMESFKKDMCACTAKDCAEKVDKAMTEYGKSMDKGDKKEKTTPEQDKKAMDLFTEYNKCKEKAMGPAMAPPTDKPADDKAAPPADKPADDKAAPPADKPADDKAAPPADKPADDKAAPPADKPADKKM